MTEVSIPPRVSILGVGVHTLNRLSAREIINDAIARKQKGYICVCPVHTIVQAQDDRQLRDILNQSFLTTPDGMPTVWIGKWRGFEKMERVYGPDLMLDICGESVKKGYRHFLYGGDERVAEELSRRLKKKFPGIQVVGTHTPPFRSLTPNEEEDLVEKVANAKPDIIWVGISSPKQDFFMQKFLPRLETSLMIGVGAAFDFHTGRKKEAPDWMKRSGLQWVHRLASEPRRLWKRYLISNPRFVYGILKESIGRS